MLVKQQSSAPCWAQWKGFLEDKCLLFCLNHLPLGLTASRKIEIRACWTWRKMYSFINSFIELLICWTPILSCIFLLDCRGTIINKCRPPPSENFEFIREVRTTKKIRFIRGIPISKLANTCFKGELQLLHLIPQ